MGLEKQWFMIYPIPGDSLFKDVLDCTMKNNTTANTRYEVNVSSVLFRASSSLARINILSWLLETDEKENSAELIGQLHLGG